MFTCRSLIYDQARMSQIDLLDDAQDVCKACLHCTLKLSPQIPVLMGKLHAKDPAKLAKGGVTIAIWAFPISIKPGEVSHGGLSGDDI